MAWTYGYSIAKEELNELIRKLGEDLKGLIVNKIAPKRPIVRQLRPQDLGYANPSWEIKIPAGATKYEINFTVPENKAIGIFGFSCVGSDIVKEVEVYAGSKRVALIPLEDVYTVLNYSEYNAKFLTGEDILKIPERTNVKLVLNVYPAPGADTPVKFVILGVIAEAEGDLISY